MKNEENRNKGRPTGSTTKFEVASERTKRRRTLEVREKFSTQELSYAAQMSLRSSGAVDASKILKDITSASPSRAHKYLQAYKSASKLHHSETSEDEYSESESSADEN